MTEPAIPADKVNLRLLLVSGKKSDLLVNASDLIDSVCNNIFSNWPKGMNCSELHNRKNLNNRKIQFGMLRMGRRANTIRSNKLEGAITWKIPRS